ncbi:MAG: hypothetical protein JXB35_06135 [Anaerolineae bacterium]|nr:hypothetical protein [Anaerolineae bacterium]
MQPLDATAITEPSASQAPERGIVHSNARQADDNAAYTQNRPYDSSARS